MQNLLLLFARVGNLILFLFLEIICIYLIVNFNKSQNEIFINSSNIISGKIYDNFSAFSDYFKLKKTNEKLADENSKILEELLNLKASFSGESIDTSSAFKLFSAKVINNSINLKNNKITLNKGEKAGLKVGMGIIGQDGIIGIIDQVTQNYSTAITLLNLQINISVKIKKNGEIGELKWDGRSVNKLNMEAVPPHVVVENGDTIITSGYSAVFPEGLMVGKVVNKTVDRRNGFQSLKVELNNKLSNLDYVYVIQDLSANERLNLENNE